MGRHKKEKNNNQGNQFPGELIKITAGPLPPLSEVDQIKFDQDNKEIESRSKDKTDHLTDGLSLARLTQHEFNNLIERKRTLSAIDPLRAADMAVDSAGNCYVAVGHQVLKFNNNGTQSIYAGNGEAGYSGDGSLAIQAKLNSPSSLAIRGNDLFILDSGNAVIRKVDSHGSIRTIATIK